MSQFTPIIAGVEGEQFIYTSDQRNALGTRMVFADGREFRYVHNGAAAAVAGMGYQSEVPGANFDELVIPTAVAAGSKTVVVTNGATALTKDDLKEGYLNVEDDAGEGHLYKIAGNTADAGAGAVTITLECGLAVAITTATTVGLWKNPFKDVIIHPSPPTAKLVGVAQTPIAANNYGWLQTKGPASVRVTGTVVIGRGLQASLTVDGTFDPAVLVEGGPNTNFDVPIVGTVMEVSATTENTFAWLLFD